MAHFAIVKKSTGEVIRVDVVDNVKLHDEKGVEQEAKGALHLKKVYSRLTDFSIEEVDFIQTSYNGNFRKNYAAIGDTYDAGKDAFIKPKPTYPKVVKDPESTIESPVFITLEGEWVLNDETCMWDFIETVK